MAERINLPMKPGRILFSLINVLIIVGLFFPQTTMTADNLPIPIPTYPRNAANTTFDTDPPLGVPTFSWTSVLGANQYRLQVDTEIDFNLPIFLDITTRNSSYTPLLIGHIFSDGKWFWRVRIEDPSPVGAWSPIFNFTKTWAAPDQKPVLLAPSEGEFLAFFDSTDFSWTPVLGAARYRFQIATTPFGFDPPFLSVETLSTTYQPIGRITNGLYYWRVVPLDSADQLGTPSAVQSFNAAYGQQFRNLVPTLINPQDESQPTFTPAFHWTAVQGAEYYRLEYTSDETCDFSVGIGLETRQTSYTPSETFPNDIRYCWRVRVESGNAVGDWSLIWHFIKKWDLKPNLLTPTNFYQTALYPLFSWTPVPGAASYLIQISQESSFYPILEESITANTTYSPQYRYDGTAHYWWRVRPIDGSGNFGVVSDVAEFISHYKSIAPILIYPLFYYKPNNFSDYGMNPYEDRTVAYPIFIWHRVMTPSPIGGVFADAYRIQVDNTPYFNSVDWQYDTENTSATPTTTDDFIPSADQNYYWRVCPLDNVENGDCLVNPSSGSIWWSQVWTTQFSTKLGMTPTIGEVPELLRPAIGQESVEATPLLEWWPFAGATQYQVQVSRDEIFTASEITETVRIPSYSLKFSLAQRRLNRTDYGTFYWHVRGFTGDGWSGWSDTWRFQIASQSEWRYTRVSGSNENKLDIGHDLAGDASPAFDLTTLYSSQSQYYWYFGFDANPSPTNMTYALYIDLDNAHGSGAVSPPDGRNYLVSTVPEHQPEFAIYVDVIDGIINPQNTWVFARNGSSWGIGQKFSDIAGDVYASGGYVELKVPNAAIGMSQETSSASLVLFSVNPSDGLVQDTVPSNPGALENGLLSRFSAVSERMNLVYPPSTNTGDPTRVTSVQPFYWDWPTGDNGATPFVGSVVQVDQDETYSPPHDAMFQKLTNTSYFSENNGTLLTDIVGDNIYYWRVQPRYFLEGHPEALGTWVGGWSFNRHGFTAQNLATSVTFATPSFSWDTAEGAGTYRLQVATDPDFITTVIDITTQMNSFTPPDTLAPGLYYWRIQIKRFGNIENDWSEVKQFALSLPTPTGLAPDDGIALHTVPTFCWDPLVSYINAEPVLTAWRYSIQVSTDSDFSNLYDSIETDNNCWTSTMGYNDGTYYWRVAMFDGMGRIGPYSSTATFTKEFPSTTPVSPLGGIISTTPTFIWTPVDGAAAYLLEVSKSATFSPIYDSVNTINTQYTPTKIYETDTQYHWRVAIKDWDGNQGPFTDATIGVDTSPPTGTIVINNGAIYTGSPLVMLTLSATDLYSGVHEMRFSNDGII